MVEDVKEGTTLDGIDNVNVAFFVPIVVAPFLVTHSITHVSLAASVKYGANVSTLGVQVVDTPISVPIVPEWSAQSQDIV